MEPNRCGWCFALSQPTFFKKTKVWKKAKHIYVSDEENSGHIILTSHHHLPHPLPQGRPQPDARPAISIFEQLFMKQKTDMETMFDSRLKAMSPEVESLRKAQQTQKHSPAKRPEGGQT